MSLAEKQNELLEFALADIYQICIEVPAASQPEFLTFAEIICRRILSSPHRIRTRPTFFNAPFERKLWEDYYAGEIKAPHTDVPAIVAAQILTLESPASHITPNIIEVTSK